MTTHSNITSTSLQIEGVTNVLRPSAVVVHDAMSTLRRIVVSVVDDGDVLRDKNLLRKGAQLDVLSGDAPVRRFEGIVMKVRESWRAGGAVVELTLGSPLDLLGLSSDCRIFQEMTVPEIVSQVLTDAGFPADRVVKRLGTYQKLASCTQYDETMLAFITRLLEAEGAYYFFEDRDDGLSLVLGDSASAHEPAKTDTLPFIEHAGLLGTWRVQSITETEEIRPQKVTLRDLDFEKPDLDLETKEEATAAGAIEFYDHPGGYKTAAAGQKRAKARLDGFIAHASGVEGVGIAPALSAGSTFTLDDAPRDCLSIEWLVTSVEHTYQGAADPSARWTTKFRAIPKSVPYRPLLSTPRPRIRGPQTAFVTGPSGQEIHTDQYGRVTLKFHWDRHSSFDEKSSAWARVAELAMSGSSMVPRVGWEVVVEFEHGDPDRPVVIGRVFNGMYVPPYPLPDRKTVSTLGSYVSPDGAGHNEIRIDDLAGSEHVHWHAQKDFELKVASDRKAHVTQSRMVTVKVDETITVKGNRTFEVKGLWDVTVAGNQSLTVEGERKKTVKKDERISIEGNRKLKVDGAQEISSQSDLTISAEGDVATTIARTLSESADGPTSIVVGDDLSLTVGGPKTETAKKGKLATIEGKQTLTVGGAMMNVSGKDLLLTVGGKRTSTVGAAWNLTSAADVQMSSGDAMEITVGAALTMAGAAGIVFKVGGSKVFVGGGGVTIESSKVTVAASGPLAVAAAAIASK